MSISIIQQPLGLTPSNAYHAYSVGSTLTGQTDFRYVVDVYMNPYASNSEKVARLKIQPNTIGTGVFNLETILRNYVKPNPRSEQLQMLSGLTSSTAISPNGVIPFSPGSVQYSNAYNTNSNYEFLDHITEYRIMIGEQYYSGGTTILDIPTDPSVPPTTFYTDLIDQPAGYLGTPNTIEWFNAGGAIRNYTTGLSSGVTYTHYTSGGTFVASGSTTGLTGDYLAALEPDKADVFCVTEKYSGYRCCFVWDMDATGWTNVGCQYTTSSAAQMPDAITIWPGVQNNTNNFDYNNILNSVSLNANGINNQNYYQAYEFRFTGSTNISDNNPAHFLSTFGDNMKVVNVDSSVIGPAFSSSRVRHRNHHYKCPLLVSAFLGKNPLFTNNFSSIVLMQEQDKYDNYNQISPVSYSVFSGSSFSLTDYQDPKYRIVYWNLQPYLTTNTDYTNGKMLVWASNGSSNTQKRNYTGYGQSELVEYNFFGDECLSTPEHFLFLNSNGVWDTWSFDRKNVRKLQKQNKVYAQGGIRNNRIFNPLSSQPRKVIYDNTTTEIMSCQSHFIDVNDVKIVEDIFNSTQVFLIKDYERDGSGTAQFKQPYLVPCLISNNSFEEYTGRYNKLYQYSFDVEYNPFQQYRVNL